jgi:C4-dicarboxylate-specific signal transduction histidine kinase
VQSAVDPSAAAAAPAGADRGTPSRPAGLLDRAVMRYGVAVVFVAAAAIATFLIDLATGSLSTFPFYAAVVGSAWFGFGPGCLALVLSAVAVEDIWTPPLFSLRIDLGELPAFLLFVACAVMSLAWSAQRRRAQTALETTVRQRTGELLRANAALQVEIAEREAAEQERTRTEQALRDAEAELARTLRLATLAELAAAIAHEINQPLAAIAANGSACVRSLAQQPPLLDNAREAAACIVADSHRAGDVIARIRALFNKEKPKEEVLNLNDLIRHVLDISRGAIERQRVTACVELAAAAPWVVGDPVQLQQVLVNLVTNALDALAEVASRPRLLTIRSAVARGEAVVTVEDSGDGVAPGQIPRIFDSFYTTKPDGIGVGLAISRSIIEAHGGSLWAAPDGGRGGRIGFSLPAAAPPA